MVLPVTVNPPVVDPLTIVVTPSGDTVRYEVPDDEAIVNIVEVEPAVPFIDNSDPGVELPIPILPFCNIAKSEAPVEDDMFSGLVPPVPRRDRVPGKVEEPIAILL